jgi:transcriptional regulator with XRE-family HTH domain
VLTYGVAETFGELLKKYVARQGWSLREFDRRVCTGEGFISQVVRGEATPPPDRLLAWATELKLEGREFEEFMAAGRIARAKGKKDSAAYVSQLVEKNERLVTAGRAACGLARTLIGHLENKGIQVPKELVKQLQRLEAIF